MIKFSQKGFALLGIIAVVLLTAVLGGGGYVLVSRQSNLKTENKEIEEKEELPQEKNKPTIQKTEQGTAEPTETKGGKKSPQKNEEAPALKSTVKIFLIALEDQGRFGKLVGCGDSVVSVDRTITTTDHPPIKEALNEFS